MSVVLIGDWVMRERRGVPHLVESLVAGDAVTRCGRRMRNEATRDGLLVASPFGTRKCRQCTAESTEETTP